jgi:hypothetical protein
MSLGDINTGTWSSSMGVGRSCSVIKILSRKSKEVKTVRQIWQNLPKKAMLIAGCSDDDDMIMMKLLV